LRHTNLRVVIRILVLLEQLLDLLLDDLDGAPRKALSEAALADVAHRRRDAMRPDVVVDVQCRRRDAVLVAHGVLDDEHLRDVGDLEQVPAIVRLLRLDNVGQVHELGRVRRAVDLERGAAGV
jgi:hypothetical protein